MTSAQHSSPISRKLEKYSIGFGDRFAHQARAQLRACMLAEAAGLTVVPVWNKSNREHSTIGSKPATVREKADAAVRSLRWKHSHYVDADHINLATLDGFLAASDFFTIDVAAAIGQPAPPSEVHAFVGRHPELLAPVSLPGIDQPLHLSHTDVENAALKYLFAVHEAALIYQRLEEGKPSGFVTEVSMDETDTSQTPAELLVILAAIADMEIPIQTIAPKFAGRFNKGVDYVGDPEKFEQEFRSDIAVIAHAVSAYGLPDNLKLSVHSGSDKFSIYAAIRRTLRDTGAGVHVKTAGTTWLEELIGLAEAGGEGLVLAKDVYIEAYAHQDELCAPYASVIDIDPAKLPAPERVSQWTAEQYVNALRHEQSRPEFNPNFRQLLHVGYKIAAHMGTRYLDMLVACEENISRNVTTNLFDRHLEPLFLANGGVQAEAAVSLQEGAR
jgi:tagaturonate epimerase